MSQDGDSILDELFDQICCQILNQVKTSHEQTENENLKLIKALEATDINFFDLFSGSYQHLLKILDSQKDIPIEDDTSSTIKKQLKLCIHDRNPKSHSCIFSILVNNFKSFKSFFPKQELNLDNNDNYYLLINNFYCVSQIPVLLDLLNVSSLEKSKLISLTQKYVDSENFIHASILISEFNIYDFFDSNYLLLNLLFMVNTIIYFYFKKVNNLFF